VDPSKQIPSILVKRSEGGREVEGGGKKAHKILGHSKTGMQYGIHGIEVDNPKEPSATGGQ